MAESSLFSAEEYLNWFCVANPLPKVPEGADVVRGPGVGRSAAIEKLKAKAAEAEAAKEREKQARRPPPVRQSSPKKPDYYDRVRKLQESHNFYDDGEEDETYESGRPLNPDAAPGDDDYDPQTYGNDGDLYKHCDFDHNSTPFLPIASHRNAILRSVESHPVTVIQGETGCGKSTQVPQYILDDHVRRNKYCNIVCTQPRRIAATSLAKYVAHCRGWQVGGIVGYQIGMDRKVSEETHLSFVTTGVLLQKMIHMKNLAQFTHIILDEVHERDQDTDFCLLVVRKLLRTNSKHVKVILMSATIEAQMFANYFSSRVSGVSKPAPRLSVEGRTHSVLEYYLDDITHVGTCKQIDLDNPRVSEETMTLAQRLILQFDLQESSDPMYGKGQFVRGTVLVFLPGMPEIIEMKNLLGVSSELYSWTIIPLHSSISGEEQHKVFLEPELGHRKIILATNIAESSITVPDISYVIDFCLVKQLMCDWQTKYVSLKTVLASRAALTQRKGRAGRVAKGRCYRMIKREFYKKSIPEYTTPEMLVQPFSSLKVTSQMLRFGSAFNCQGYFGTTSLMGVVAVLILLVILYLSSVFIFSIQSIDRFDDPKGETINVENLH